MLCFWAGLFIYLCFLFQPVRLVQSVYSKALNLNLVVLSSSLQDVQLKNGTSPEFELQNVPFFKEWDFLGRAIIYLFFCSSKKNPQSIKCHSFAAY